MDDRFNTIAGWVLFAGIIALGSSIVAGEMFHSERPEKMGYPIEGVEQEGEGGAAAEQPIEIVSWPRPTRPRAQQIFKKCAACHNADKGGANAARPEPVGRARRADREGQGLCFLAMRLSKKGGTWNWDNLSQWLTSPKNFAPGTKMTFAGLSNPQDRADVIVLLNQQSDSPQPLPKAPAATTDASAAKPGTGPNNGPQKAEKEPTLPAQAAGKSPQTSGGDAGDKPGAK